MYTNNRDAYRQFFFTAWQKHKNQLPLDATEIRLITIIQKHPEYHSLLEKESTTHQEFNLEENPFFHLSLHYALREQIDTKRPAGIEQIQQQLNQYYADHHYVEHLMMECLCKMMAYAQETGAVMSDEKYLESLRMLIK